MSDTEEFDGPATGRSLPRSSGGVILDDADRAFLYRVVSIHARAGIAPVESLGAIASSLLDQRPGDAIPAGALARRGKGAEAIAQGLTRDAPTLDAGIEASGLRLGPLERACLRLPASRLADTAVAAAVFEGLAGLFEGDRRR